MLPNADSTSTGDATRLRPILTTDRGGLGADAVFRVGTSPVILFKSSAAGPEEEEQWHRVAWNIGVAPLLWVTTPEYIKIYNAYQPPEEYGKQAPLLREFPFGADLARTYSEVGRICGRRHVAMGSFWRSEFARSINRESRVDNVLLRELEALLTALISKGIPPSLAQKLVGRCIFFQYLIHRGYLSEDELIRQFGAPNLHSLLLNVDNVYRVFRWIRLKFNGDLFPIENEDSEREQLGHSSDRLQPLSDFFGNFNISDRQGRLFPFRFDAIPVELISSIYEKFAHLATTDGISTSGIHYTPINLVDFILDPLFENVDASARVLDPACGSGVFLVESLRRLAWLRSRSKTLTREVVNDILVNQVRGVDISPAALSIAAFSLYLAVLELDPAPPSGIDALECLRFEPLQNRVLFATSAFSQELEQDLLADGPNQKFDLIVGNPPWTYDRDEKAADRELVKERRIDDTSVDPQHTTVPAEENRSGTTYARLHGLAIPARSPDWAFLWRCRDFAHSETRIALVMKATPFFSLAPNTVSAREALLRSFPNVAIINLSQLRTSRLFQEYRDENDETLKKRPRAGPALLFFSNCIPTNSDCISVMELPWSSTFARTGVFQLPAEPPKVLQLSRLRALPGLLKAAAFGTERDVWFLERLSRNEDLCTLGAWLETVQLPAGNGYQTGQTMDADHLVGLPQATARDIHFGRLRTQLPRFSDAQVHRSRNASQYKGPLVLLPEGSLARSPLRGRYTAVFDPRDIAYNESFFGISFVDHDSTFARALAAVMHSRLVGYQLALTAGTVGVKQTKVEVVDLTNIRIPRIDNCSDTLLQSLADAFDALTKCPNSDVARIAGSSIDRIVEDMAGLSDNDRNLLGDADRRAAAVFFETRSARKRMVDIPRHAEIRPYAENVCAIFNAFASEADDHVLAPQCYAQLARDVIVVKFALISRTIVTTDPDLRSAQLESLGDGLNDLLGGAELPYVAPAKALRLYVGSEIFLIKPAQYRCFSPAAGQSDADRIIDDLMTS